jgi:hypothetical protein
VGTCYIVIRDLLTNTNLLTETKLILLTNFVRNLTVEEDEDAELIEAKAKV